MNEMCKIIAEIGWNHIGDIDLADKMTINKGLDVQECELNIHKNYRGRCSKN